MPKTAEEMKAWEIQAYGRTKEELVLKVQTQFPGPPSMVAYCFLSDAQELIAPERGTARDREEARQAINIAKFIIHTFMEDKDD